MRNGNDSIIQKSSNRKENDMLPHLSEVFTDFIQKLQTNYGSSLEQYILDRNPQSSADVERLTFEFNMKQTRGYL